MNDTSNRWRIVIVAAAVLGAIWISATEPIRLGLDLRGGTQIVLEARDTEVVAVDGDVADRTLEVLRRRVDALGVSEPSLQRSGDRRIIVELPGVDDPEEAVEVIGRTAQLSIHPVVAADRPEVLGEPADGELDLLDETGLPVRLGPQTISGDGVTDAQARLDQAGLGWQVTIDFRAASEWAALTGEAACASPGDPRRRVAIALDREVITSPQVGVGVPCGTGIPDGSTSITGDFTQAEAQDLALLIRAGALPVPVDIVEQRTVGPTLGEAAIEASVQATLIGAALTLLFLIVYYRYLGLLAGIALGIYALLALAVLQLIGATLTLPGIAGFVLAIGMAVDGNVLVFERFKEDHAAGRPLRSAARSGFERAFSAIADANVTTLIAAGVLFFFASGGVRGFGITLAIGVVVSMFTALVVTRMLIELSIRRKRLVERPTLWGMGVGTRLRTWVHDRGPDLAARRRLLLALAGASVVIAASGLFVRDVQFGLDFTGGRLIEYQADQTPDLDELREDLAGIGFPRAVVQESGQGNVAIRVRELDRAGEEAIDDAITARLGSADRVRDEFVGPTIGDELRRSALIALGLALTLQLAYLAARFRWTYGISSIVALAQGAIIVVGTFVWMGKEIDTVFVAALLTVVGYAVNDSVVVFDRIREERTNRPRATYSTVANDAVLETIPRTVNTGLSTLFILVALWLLGGDTLADFALALIIGIIAGTTATATTAMPLSTLLERSPVGDRERRPPRPAADQPRRPAAVEADPVTPQKPPSRPIPPRPRTKRRR
jgi:SecD/SecF fusion protein